MRQGRSENGFVVKFLRNTVLILLLIMFVSIVVNFRNSHSPTETALMEEATDSCSIKGVFIRSEEVINYSGEGVLSYSVADGGKVGKDTVIARAYPDETQIETDSEIERLSEKLSILKKIQNPGTLESAQPASIAESIEENYRSLVYARDLKNYSSMEENISELLVEMCTYQLITDEVVSFEPQIAEIEAQLKELEDNSIVPSEIILSERPAYFVSFCDGYENLLSPEKLSTLTADDIENVRDEKSKDKTIAGKLIDGYSWYLAGVVDNSSKKYAIGDAVKLRFDSSAETFDAVITDIHDSGDVSRSVIIAECSQFNYDLVQKRYAKTELIKGEGVYRGLRVPRNSIRFADVQETVYDENTGESIGVNTVNYKGVYIQKGEQVTFRKIDVIYEGEDYVLSAVHENDETYLALYDDIIIEGVD